MEVTQKELLDQVKELMSSILSQVSELELKLYQLEDKVKEANGLESEAVSIPLEDFIAGPNDTSHIDVTSPEPDTTPVASVITSVEPVITSVEPEITTIEPVIASIEPEITSVEPVIASIEPEISSVEPDITPVASVIASVEPEITNVEPDIIEVEPVEEQKVEEIPEEEASSSDNLFGKEYEDTFATVAKEMHRKSILEAAEGHSANTVVDAMADRCAWKTDMPGTEVKDVRSAISLNDRILFIRNLFADDVALFQKTIEIINSASSLDDVTNFIEQNFPTWNMKSDIVYRFMMAVRRKVR